MGGVKHEWKKAEKQWYGTDAPVELEVPTFGFFVVEGQGNPNKPAFQVHVELLYALAYGVRMGPRSGLELPGYFEYTVYPLEGVWDLKVPPGPGPINKDDLVYRLMIRQPDFLDAEGAHRVVEAVARKKKLPGLDAVTFEQIHEGRCVQLLHRGSYDDEPASFRRIQDYCRKNSLARVGHTHREIYLTDARKTAPADYLTLLRVPVRDHFSCD